LGGPSGRYKNAYVPEQPAIYEYLSVWEHLPPAASAFGMDKPFIGPDPRAIRDHPDFLKDESFRRRHEQYRMWRTALAEFSAICEKDQQEN